MLGSAWNGLLDCSVQGPGLAVLEVRRSALQGVPTPFGQVLIGGGFVFRAVRPQPGSPCDFTWNLPLEMTLVGLGVHAQGLCSGGTVAVGHAGQRQACLSNAIGLRLGF